MKTFLAMTVGILIFTFPALAQEIDQSELLLLDQETFVRFDRSDPEQEVIQLFKITDGEIDLIDAIQLKELRVNFKKRLEYRRLRIDEKS